MRGSVMKQFREDEALGEQVDSGDSMSPRPDERHQLASATRKLRELSEEADGLLTKLTRLRQNLADIRRESHNMLATTPLVEANEQLVLAALHAETVAETAVSKLGELARSSQRDPLTNIPNRLLMLDRLESAIAAARRRETRIGVMFIDLD